MIAARKRPRREQYKVNTTWSITEIKTQARIIQEIGIYKHDLQRALSFLVTTDKFESLDVHFDV